MGTSLLAVLALVGTVGVGLVWAVPVQAPTDRLNVFVIPHSHCDPGWLKSVDEYYLDDVRVILDSTMAELALNPERKFTWVEQSFFSKWWANATDAQKHQVRTYVAEGRLEFNLGGWVMSDEATTTYSAVIDQLTEGHEYLLDILGAKPKVAWHIDPFGHSTFTPEMFALAGFDAWVGNRILYRQKDEFKHDKLMEFIWEGEMPVDGRRSRMFTHILDSHYSAPSGFDFEGFSWLPNPSPITPSNVGARAIDLIDIFFERAAWYKTNNLLIPLGDDFKFRNATAQFASWDQLMAHVREHPELGVDMQYAVLSDYVAAVHKTNTTWPKYTGDFLSYADDSHSFWSGFYTSRPLIKRQVRWGAAMQRGIEALHVVAPEVSEEEEREAFNKIRDHRRALGLTQHHDGVTGTEKAAVLEDYEAKLQQSLYSAASVANNAMTHLSSKSPIVNFTHDSSALEELSSTPSLAVPVSVFNSAGWKVSTVVEFAAPTCQLRVTTLEGETVASQVNAVDGELSLLFVADDIPPMGLRTFLLSADPSAQCTQPEFLADGQGANITNGVVVVTISGETHRIESIGDVVTQQTQTLSADVLEYRSLDFVLAESVIYCPYYNHTNANCPPPNSQSSGAYIFRPAGPAVPVHQGSSGGSSSVPVALLRGPVAEEVVMDFGDERKGMYRLARVSGELSKVMIVRHEVKLLSQNRELVVRFGTDLKTNGSFYTDDSALRWEHRTRRADAAEPIAANYYPMEVMAGLQDEDSAFLLFADRTHGVSSLADGEFEVMLHRRCSRDDGRGLGEALDDLDSVSPTLWVTLVSAEEASRVRHTLSTLWQSEPMVFFGTKPANVDVLKQTLLPSRSLLKQALPANLHLLSFAVRAASANDVVLRVQHLYDAADPNGLGKEAAIDLADLLTDDIGTLTSFDERTLTLNRPVSALKERLQWLMEDDEETAATTLDESDTKIILQPLAIRTFLATFTPTASK